MSRRLGKKISFKGLQTKADCPEILGSRRSGRGSQSESPLGRRKTWGDQIKTLNRKVRGQTISNRETELIVGSTMEQCRYRSGI